MQALNTLDQQAAEAGALEPDRTKFPAPVVASTWSMETLPEPDQIFVGAFDTATKVVTVAPSKARKSFFMLQAAICLAAGLPRFLAWEIPRPRRVMLVNLEITPAHFHKRLTRMMRALSVAPEMLGDRLLIINARGLDVNADTGAQLLTTVKSSAVELAIIDPIYKLIAGDESKQEVIKELLRGIDRLCNETGAAVWYAHHTGKGEAGDRLAIDRANGSGVLARDFDCQIGLVHHVEDGLFVCEQIARSYAPREVITIGWDNEAGCFTVRDDVTPVVRTSRNRDTSGRVGPVLTDDDALAVVAAKPLPSEVFKGELRHRGFTERAARETRARLLNDGKLDQFRAGFPCTIHIGTPEGIQKLRSEYQNPKLAGVK